MAVPTDVQQIRGADRLYEWFGYWPNFHDAEILSLHLDRTGTSALHIHTWEMSSEVDERGYYTLRKHAVVEFLLENVNALSLGGFSIQNVIFGLFLEKIPSGFKLTLDPCYGLAGSIEAEKVEIRFTPGEPSAE